MKGKAGEVEERLDVSSVFPFAFAKKYTDLAAGMSACIEFGEDWKLSAAVAGFRLRTVGWKLQKKQQISDKIFHIKCKYSMDGKNVPARI